MGRTMERTRSISITLIFLSLVLGSNIRNISNLGTKDYVFLGSIIVIPHLTGIIVSKNKFLQNVSPFISAFFGLEILLYISSSYKISKLLPTMATLKNLVKQGQLGITQFQEQNIPVKHSIAIVVVVAFTLWAVSELIETFSNRLQYYKIAFSLYVAFFAISTHFTNNKFDPISITLFCLSTWLYLRATYKLNISNSAHKITIDAKTKFSISLKNAFIIFTLIAICIAIVLPISKVPSLNILPDNLIDKFTNKSATTELSPLVSMRAQLKDEQNILLFTAKTDTAQYFRISVLNKFDGETWSYVSPDKQKNEPLIEDRITTDIKASFDIKKLEPKFLPTIYNTISTSARDIDVLKDSTIYAKKGNIKNYEINASIPSNTFNETQIANGSKETPAELENYLLIPNDFDPEIETLTRQIASNKSSIYEQVIALRDYFTKGDFTYSTEVKYTSSQKSMAQFLEKRIGFCEQFASSYAAMARSIRIPSRVVIGFTPGSPDANGVFNVMSKQAHSWVEVYLTDIGWITIDPTPQGDLPGQAPANIGEIVPTTSTTSSTTIQQASTSSIANSEVTTNTIQKVPVTKINKTASTSSLFSTRNILLVIFALLIGGLIFIIKVRKKKQYANTPIHEVHNTFNKILTQFAPEVNKSTITIAEAKTKVPKDCYLTQRFLDRYSDFSYAPDSDIDLTNLRYCALDANEEIDSKERINN